jgi:hypothetical protein
VQIPTEKLKGGIQHNYTRYHGDSVPKDEPSSLYILMGSCTLSGSVLFDRNDRLVILTVQFHWDCWFRRCSVRPCRPAGHTGSARRAGPLFILFPKSLLFRRVGRCWFIHNLGRALRSLTGVGGMRTLAFRPLRRRYGRRAGVQFLKSLLFQIIGGC